LEIFAVLIKDVNLEINANSADVASLNQVVSLETNVGSEKNIHLFVSVMLIASMVIFADSNQVVGLRVNVSSAKNVFLVYAAGLKKNVNLEKIAISLMVVFSIHVILKSLATSKGILDFLTIVNLAKNACLACIANFGIAAISMALASFLNLNLQT